jgi:hypothetical protein
MKRNLCSPKRILALTIWCSVWFYQPASAQSDGVIAALTGILYSINALVWTAANYIFQTPPNVGTEVVTNYAQNTALQSISPNVQMLNEQDITSGLAPNTSTPNVKLIQLASIQASDTVVPGLTLAGVPIPFFSQATEQNKQNALAQGNKNLNFQSLITPTAYTTPDQQNMALNFIHFISGYATPISNLNLSSYPESQLSMKQKIDIQNSPAYQAYAVQRRQLIAQQSAILTNLYWIYSKRIPIQSLNPSDVAAGTMPPPNTTTNITPNAPTQTHPSARQIEEFTATWRTLNQTLSPKWYTQMSVASATNVEREKLFILAEIEALLYRMHQDNERIIALMAINQVASLQTAKTTLALAEKQVQDMINGKIKGSAQKGTTAETNQPPQTQLSPQQQAEASKLKAAQQSTQQQANQAAQQQANAPAR